jgi:hypothetical protein
VLRCCDCNACNALLCVLCRCAAGVDVRYGVDATRLYQGLDGLHMSNVQHVVWNFPLAVGAEQAADAAAAGNSLQAAKLLGVDDEANRQLMGRFLAGVSRQMAAWQPRMKVRGSGVDVLCVGAGDASAAAVASGGARLPVVCMTRAC